MFPVYGLAEASLAVTFPAVDAPLGVEYFARGALGPGDRVRPVAADAEDALELVRVGTTGAGVARFASPTRRAPRSPKVRWAAFSSAATT